MKPLQKRSMGMSFFVMPYICTVVGRFKMVQLHGVPILSGLLCTCLKRP